MTKPKTLDQIAYEADPLTEKWKFAWAEAKPVVRARYKRIAAAVAREVKRRGKRKGKE